MIDGLVEAVELLEEQAVLVVGVLALRVHPEGLEEVLLRPLVVSEVVVDLAKVELGDEVVGLLRAEELVDADGALAVGVEDRLGLQLQDLAVLRVVLEDPVEDLEEPRLVLDAVADVPNEVVELIPGVALLDELFDAGQAGVHFARAAVALRAQEDQPASLRARLSELAQVALEQLDRPLRLVRPEEELELELLDGVRARCRLAQLVGARMLLVRAGLEQLLVFDLDQVVPRLSVLREILRFLGLGLGRLDLLLVLLGHPEPNLGFLESHLLLLFAHLLLPRFPFSLSLGLL